MIQPGSYIILENYPKSLDQILKRIFPNWPTPNPDLLLIEGGTSIGIDQIRQIKRFLKIKNWQAVNKVVVINQGEKLTIEAQNALLKTLEEPGENKIIIVKTKTLQSLLPTIISRCHLLKGKEGKKEPTKILLQRLLNLSLEQRLKFLDQLHQESENPEKVIEELIVEGQKLLLRSPQRELTKISQAILKLLTGQKMLHANLAPEQVFDWLAINL